MMRSPLAAERHSATLCPITPCSRDAATIARDRVAAGRFFSRFMVALVGLTALLLGAPARADSIVIHAGRLVDVERGSVVEKVDIVVEGNRIRQVGSNLDVPDGAREIDLLEMTVLPGLIDSHGHVCLVPEDSVRSPVLYKTNPYRALEALDGARRDLMAGFTTMRDLDNEGADMADIAVRDAIREGMFAGPRLYVSGWAISITSGHMNLTGLRPSVDRKLEQLAIMADSPGAMVAAIRDQVKSGVDLIKIYATGAMRHIDRETLEPMSQMSVEEVRLMVREAARWGIDVAAHAYGGEGAYNAVAGGARSIEHGMLLDDRTLDLMVERGTFYSPTMTVYLPDEDDDPEERAFLDAIVERHRDTFRRAMRKGVKIAFGTDAGSLPHGEGWRELVRMSDYGMPPIEVIRSATVVGAELLREENELGRIAPGYFADIIAVRGRPERDIEALREVSFVMAGGVVVKEDR